MIRWKNRFHGHNAVTRVHGPSVHSDLFSIKYARNTVGDYRLAVVVSKKIDKRAVTRNRIRRRIFEAIRKQGVVSGQPLDLVLYVKSASVATMHPTQIESELAKAVGRVVGKALGSFGRPQDDAIVKGKEK